MRQFIFALVSVVVVVQVAIAQVLVDGDYRLYYGNYQVPHTYRFVTAEPDAREGQARTFPRQESDLQIWRLKNYPEGQVTLESKGALGKYLGLRRSGANPGAYLGVVPTAVHYNISRQAGGPFTYYELEYPQVVNGKVLIVSLETENKTEPYYVNFGIQGTEGIRGGFKFWKV
ncbi:hypothetical protein BG004_006335 [Podila humilis]|nr:hypothetical protein BG004_006335 [Podila humilis]